MKKSIKISGLFFWMFCLINCHAQDSEQIVKQRIKDKNIPGFAFIVAHNGEIVKEGYYGLANLELNVPVTKKSVFAIASMSKTYTAVATLLLVEEGKLRLEESIRKHIPEAPESWNAITIKHLLTHSSGLVDDWGLYNWDKSNELFLKSQTDSSFLEHLFAQNLLFEPGSNHSYSCGPFVLGVVIERITGQYYEEYLKLNIFNPLGLVETFVDNPYKIIPNRVSGYFSHDTTKMNTGISGMGNGILLAPVAYGRADVGIRTTARDLLKFYNSLLNGKLLNDQSMKIMFQPATLDSGDFIPTAPGWMNWPLAGNLILEHSGGFRTGFSSQGFVIPKDNFVVILLSNLNGGSSFPIVQKIAALYYPELEPLSNRKADKDEKTALTVNHLNFFQKIDSNLKNSDVFNKAFPVSYYSKNLKKSIARSQDIEYLGERNVSDEEIQLFNVKIHTLRYYKLIQKNKLYTTVYLDGDDKIVFIDYPETE